jgi:hypothetical protein
MWQVDGRLHRGLLGWLASGDYQPYDPFQPTTFSLYYADPIVPAAALGFDSTRFAAAAFETIHNLPSRLSHPRALGWLIIQSYYAGFFSSQAILRMLGISLTYLDSTGINRITNLASAYGSLNGVSLSTGLYTIRSNRHRKCLEFTSSNAGNGAHVAMWRTFTQLLTTISAEILTSAPTSTHTQKAAFRLTNLRLAMTENGGRLNGSWLSVVRNSVNYELDYGVWYPYQGSAASYETLPSILTRWLSDPLSWELFPDPSRELHRFFECCASLVGICRELCLDMESLAPHQRCFHRYGATAVLRHFGICKPHTKKHQRTR